MIELDFPHIDYFSFTSARPLPKVLEKDVLSNEQLLPARRMQYAGYMRGSAFSGRAGREFYTECSGEASEDLFYNVMAEKGFEAKASRIDLQITTSVEPCQLASLGEHLLSLHNAGHFKRHIVLYSTETVTIYIGSPKSEKRLRIYEKVTDQGERLARFEVQYRKKSARAIYKCLESAFRDYDLYSALAGILQCEANRVPHGQMEMFEFEADPRKVSVRREERSDDAFLKNVVAPYVRKRVREEPSFIDQFNELVVRLVEANYDVFRNSQ